MRAMRLLVLVVLGMGGAVSAQAAPAPAARGAIVGGVSLGAAAGGALVGGLAGFGLGLASCELPGASWECMGALAGPPIGAGAGWVVGAPVGGALAARAVGARPGRTLAYTGIAAGVAAGLGGAFIATGEEALGLAALGTAALGMPVLAGVAAGTDRAADGAAVGLIVAPTVGRDRVGATLVVGF